ncbi:NTP transferase domain-containing protein, partial [Pseudomonas sp.]|uniref:nucleotidyltransferase family protein n=1 Tax=Pseudomonas sp. TaxID=306 RepID=UPI0028AA3CF9
MRSKQLNPSRSEVAAIAAAPCAALVLAAGRGRRFGSDKRLAGLADGQALLAATLSRVQAQFDEVWVVIAGHDDAEALGVPPAVRVVHAQQADSGMGASLAAGIGALAGSGAEAAAVLLGDMPWLAGATLAR